MIIGQRISTAQFSYQNGGLWVQESSSLPQGFEPTRQLYDDACDQGFVLVGALSGKEFPFYLDGVDYDRDGAIAGWRFKSSRSAYRVLIIND
jgi:hypothetical protein